MLCVVGICTTCNVVLFQGGLPWRDVCVKTFAQRVTDTSRLLYSPTTFSSLFLKKQERHKKTKLSNCQSYNEYDFLYIIKMQMILNLEKP